MIELPFELQVAGFVAILLLIAYGVRKSASAAGNREAKLAPDKGWLSDEEVSLSDALVVADRHLSTARSGSNVRLQYGKQGCLTLIRRVTRKKETTFGARWEFWEPDDALAEAMTTTKGARLEIPKPEVLELWFDADYVTFKRTVETLFDRVPVIVGKTHLTWVC
ncbi:MAG: hypothetical protein AAFN59_08425 [Pseudomonadota bacterium]